MTNLLLQLRIVFYSWPECVRDGVKVPESLTLLVTKMLHNMALKLLLQRDLKYVLIILACDCD